MAFVKRKLRATITLAKLASGAQPTFQQSGATSGVFSNLRMSARIKNAGGALNSTMDLSIWGMSANNMNQLSTLGLQFNLVPNNPIILAAGDDVDGVGTVFQGYILFAYADYSQAPNVPFIIHALAAVPQIAAPAQATSFQGSADVGTMMSSIAAQMSLKFENNGVNQKISNPYYSGDAHQQFMRLKRDAGINGIIDPGSGTLAIWPRNGSRDGLVPLITPPPQGGMIGYPAFTANGLLLHNLYDTSIGFGRKVKVQSSIPAACGEFTVVGLNHDLDALMPGGKWQSVISVYSPTVPIPVK